jgi:hypothetical protein
VSLVFPPPDQEPASHFRIEKDREPAELAWASGRRARGNFFVAGAAARHSGRELVIDLLNSQPGFVPFEIDDETGTAVRLYNPQHILFVKLARHDIDPESEPAYEAASHKAALVVFADGTRVEGTVYVFRPAGRDRLSDYTRSGEQYRYLRTSDALLIVNFAQVAEIVPLAA